MDHLHKRLWDRYTISHERHLCARSVRRYLQCCFDRKKVLQHILLPRLLCVELECLEPMHGVWNVPTNAHNAYHSVSKLWRNIVSEPTKSDAKL